MSDPLHQCELCREMFGATKGMEEASHKVYNLKAENDRLLAQLDLLGMVIRALKVAPTKEEWIPTAAIVLAETFFTPCYPECQDPANRENGVGMCKHERARNTALADYGQARAALARKEGGE